MFLVIDDFDHFLQLLLESKILKVSRRLQEMVKIINNQEHKLCA